MQNVTMLVLGIVSFIHAFSGPKLCTYLLPRPAGTPSVRLRGSRSSSDNGRLLLPASSYLSVHDPAAGFTSGGLQKDFLLLMALGRVFCKVYIRMPWPTNCRLLIIYFAQQFVKAATELAGQPMLVSCFRCGQEEELASLNTPAKVVKVLLRCFQKGLRHS